MAEVGPGGLRGPVPLRQMPDDSVVIDGRPEESLDEWVFGTRQEFGDEGFDEDGLERVMEGASHPAEELSIHLMTPLRDAILDEEELGDTGDLESDEDSVEWEIALAAEQEERP